MYAVIKTGGKQYRVATGDVIEVEHLRRAGDDETLTLTPLLVVTDDGKTLHGAKALSDFQVGAKVVGEAKGDKIKVFKYRNKTGYARKTGHRQLYSRIEITSIGDGAAGGSKASSAKAPAAKAPAAKAPAKKAPGEEASAGKASTKKAPAEKASAGKSTGEKATAKKSPAKKAPAKPATKSESGGGKSAGTEPGNVSSDGS